MIAETSPTLVALLTPPGSGAIATLGLRGPAAWDVLQEVFTPFGKKAADFFRDLRSSARPGQFWLGRLGETASGQDEVVLSLRQREPVPWLEIHCHGGRQVIVLLLEILAARGVQVCSWPELLRSSGEDALRIAALQALGAATTTRTAAILLDQYHGALEAAVQSIRTAVNNGHIEQALRELQELARWIPLGRHLTTPWKVAIAGAPNVGKSSLINRLAGYQRSVVSEIPGTTRDLVATRIALGGWPIEIVDTAGLRGQAETLEQQGMALALAAAAEADLCLWLMDAATPPVWPMHSLPNLHVVINKIDLPAVWNLADAGDALRISAQTGAGVEELIQAIVRLLVPAVPPPGTAVPFTAELCHCIDTAWQQGREGRWERLRLP